MCGVDRKDLMARDSITSADAESSESLNFDLRSCDAPVVGHEDIPAAGGRPWSRSIRPGSRGARTPLGGASRAA